MTDTPRDPHDGPDPDDSDPLAGLFGPGGLFERLARGDVSALGGVGDLSGMLAGLPGGFPGAGLPGLGGAGDLGELQRLLASSDGPVNWPLAEQVARAAARGTALPAAAADRPTIGFAPPAPAAAAGETGSAPAADGDAAVAGALQLADVWLDAQTTLPSGLGGPARAWSRLAWVDATLPVWRAVVTPVAERVVAALADSASAGLAALSDPDALPPELRDALPPELADLLRGPGAAQALGAPLRGALEQVGATLFGGQIGAAIGALSAEVVSGYDIGLPLTAPGVGALLPANVAAFGDGLDLPAEEVRVFLALREAAHARLFGHVPWLAAGLLGAVADYARGISVDAAALQSFAGSVDLSDPEALTAVLESDMFGAPSEASQRALDRLELLLALVEGWVDTVVSDACAGRLPGAERLAETLRRRRAAGGPAEQTFAALVGLQLRPRRLRDAAALWRAVQDARGAAARDALWGHPDLLPTGSDLDDPAAFAAGTAGADDPFAGLNEPGALDELQQPGPADPDEHRRGDPGGPPAAV